jgi:hypothetical protein
MRTPHLTTKERLAQATWHRVYPRRSKSAMPHPPILSLRRLRDCPHFSRVGARNLHPNAEDRRRGRSANGLKLFTETYCASRSHGRATRDRGRGYPVWLPASSQFSGHDTEVDRNGAPTPPPPVEMATLDPDVTGLVRLNVDVPEHTIQTLGLTLHQQEEITGEAPPPPPPPMDDPSDPPPSIHS